MGNQTSIEWTNHSWNPWRGCIKVSQGCKNCYMYREQIRYGKDPKVITRSKTTFNDPLKWKDSALVFTCSWSDFFIEQADEWRNDAWNIIRQTPYLTYQVLTKRPENIADRLPADWGDGWPNVWLGVSVENQEMADKRIPELLKIPVAIRFLSCEPLLSPVKLWPWLPINSGISIYDDIDNPPPPKWTREYTRPDLENNIHWVIVGGESGPNAREFKVGWGQSLIDQCKAAGVAVFMKQLGSNPTTTDLTHWRAGYSLFPDSAGYSLNLRDKKGGDMDEWPADLRVREFPKVREL